MMDRRIVEEAHAMVAEFLRTNGYVKALHSFEQEAKNVLEDIPKSIASPRPLLEVLTDIKMNQLHSQLSQMNMPSQAEDLDFSEPGQGTMPDQLESTFQELHAVNIIQARTFDVAVAPSFDDIDQSIKRVPALISAAADRTVKFTSLGDNKSVFKILQPNQGVVLDMDFHPQIPQLLLTSAMDKSTVLTNTITDTEHQQFNDHIKFVVRAKFAMDGAAIVTGSHDKTINIYKAQPEPDQSGLPVYAKEKTISFKGAVEGLCVLPTCRGRPPTVVVGTRDDNYLYYIDLNNYSITTYNMNVNKDDWVSFTPMEISASPHNDGAYLLVSTDSPSGRQILFRTGSALQLHNYYGVPTDGFSTPRHVWDPSGKYFYVTGNDHQIWCFQVGSEKVQTQLRGHTGMVRSLFFDQSSNRLISCGFDKSVRIWAPSTQVSSQDNSSDMMMG